MRSILAAFLFAVCLPVVAPAARLQISIPLNDGKLDVVQLRHTLQDSLGLPAGMLDRLPDVNLSLNLRGVSGWMLVRAMNQALGDGFQFDVENDALKISVDSTKLPADWNQTCDALARFTEVAAPQAVARQNRQFGLHLPQSVDEKRPIVILIHGLGGDSCSCDDLSKLIAYSGFQTATFAYPTERPLAENGQMLTQYMLAMHDQFPNLQIDLIAESMGGLVARQYVEGTQYAGGINHLILIAPPNAGSTWSDAGVLLKLVVNAAKWKEDSQWSFAWMINEGICQEVRDLTPQSDFLTQLNSLPRRAGVRYTIIAGDRPAACRYEANCLGFLGAVLDETIPAVWPMPRVQNAIISERHQLLTRTGTSDGPVTLSSAGLPGVRDFIVLPVDHIALFKSVGGNSPAAWPVIRDRLMN